MSASQKRFSIPIATSIILATLVIVFACSLNGRAKDKPKYIFKEGGGAAGVAASIDGTTISDDELMGDDRLEFADLLKKLFDLRMDRLGRTLLVRTYTPDAQKANMSLDDYIDKKVLKGEIKISDREYKKFVEDKKIPKEQLNEQLKERILAYMKAQRRQDEIQNLIAKLTKEHKVEVYFSKPNIKVNVDVGSAPTFGTKGKVTIVEFSDFQCPFCGRAAATVTEIKKAYSGKVLFSFKNFPLPMHPQAKPASEAAMCVYEQGTDKFWKYHDKLFTNQDKLDAENLKKFAKDVGANADQFAKCVESHKYAKTVQEDIEYGNRLGVRSTPTFFINGRILSGAQPFENFKEMIEDELSGS